MPKINIYLSDDLAEKVREANLPVSRICQAALQQSLDNAVTVDTARAEDVEALPEAVDIGISLGVHVIGFLRIAYNIAAQRGSATVEPEHLLQGFLDEGDSLVLHTIERAGISRQEIQARLNREIGTIASTSTFGVGDPKLSAAARAILDEGVREAVLAGESVLNGSHFLLGMLTDTGIAGTVLNELGIDKVVNLTVVAALTEAVAFGRAALTANRVDAWLVPAITSVINRLDRMDHKLDAIESSSKAGEAYRT